MLEIKFNTETKPINMDLLITEDMYDVAIPVFIMNDGSAFQFESFV